MKELFLEDISAAFAGLGFASVVWDHPCFGASDGTPRYKIDPWAQVRGYRDAITFAAAQPEVDAERIGIWGTSYSGGHVLPVAAFDMRVAAVACQVPFIAAGEHAARVPRGGASRPGRQVHRRLGRAAELPRWLEGVLATRRAIPPPPAEIAERLGAEGFIARTRPFDPGCPLRAW